MTDYATKTKELYKHYGTWRKVAKACGYSPAYWMRVAKNDLTPSKEAVSVLACRVTQCYQRKLKNKRKNVSFSIGLYKRMLALKNATGGTWEQLMTRALESLLKEE